VLLANCKDVQILLLKHSKYDKTKSKVIISLAVHFEHIIFKCK